MLRRRHATSQGPVVRRSLTCPCWGISLFCPAGWGRWTREWWGCWSFPLLRPTTAERWTGSLPTAAQNHPVCGPDLWQPSSLQFQLRSSSTESEPANSRIVRESSDKTSLSNVTCLVTYCRPTLLLAAHNNLQGYWTEIVAAAVRAAVLHHATLRRRARKRPVSSNYFHT